MSASSLTLAASATTISIPSTSINRLFHSRLPLFRIKPNRLKIPNHKWHYNLSRPTCSHSLVVRASAVFDSVGITDEEIHDIVEQVIGEREYDDGVESQLVEACRLFVGNLHYSVTSSQLSKIFAGAGRVVSIEIVYNNFTGRSCGFASVTMGSIGEAKEAIRLFDGTKIGGLIAKVNFPDRHWRGESTSKISSSYQHFASAHKIFAANLNWNLTSQVLIEAFAGQPGFLTAQVMYERDTGRSRGYGFIIFESAEELNPAIDAMNGVELKGRPLRLEVAGGKPEGDTIGSSSDLENSKILSSYRSSMRELQSSRRFPYVTVGSAEEAEEAIQLSNVSTMERRTPKEVLWRGESTSKIKSSYERYIHSPHEIYAKNLSWGLKSEALTEAFADEPGFLSAKVIYDLDTGRTRGCGFVSFTSAEALESALFAMNGVMLDGRPLWLEPARSPP